MTLDKLISLTNFNIQQIPFFQDAMRSFSVAFADFLEKIGVPLFIIIIALLMILSVQFTIVVLKKYEMETQVVDTIKK